ncbi:hypothetical protein HDV05_002630, partial [Chytridiales sp. JEL 0842]
ILSLGNEAPFKNGDAARGVAYVSAYLCLTNLFFFSIGYKSFGEDFRPMKKDVSPFQSEENIGRGRESGESVRVNVDAQPVLQKRVSSVSVAGDVAVEIPSSSSVAESPVTAVESGSKTALVLSQPATTPSVGAQETSEDAPRKSGEATRPFTKASSSSKSGNIFKRIMRTKRFPYIKATLTESEQFWVKCLTNPANLS